MPKKIDLSLEKNLFQVDFEFLCGFFRLFKSIVLFIKVFSDIFVGVLDKKIY